MVNFILQCRQPSVNYALEIGNIRIPILTIRMRFQNPTPEHIQLPLALKRNKIPSNKQLLHC